MKKIINENRRILMIQKVIDKCVVEMVDWCDSIEEFDFDSADFCRSLGALSKIEVRTLHEETIGVIIYVNYYKDDDEDDEEDDDEYVDEDDDEDDDEYVDMGSIFYDLELCVKKTIGDTFTLKLLNVVGV